MSGKYQDSNGRWHSANGKYTTAPGTKKKIGGAKKKKTTTPQTQYQHPQYQYPQYTYNHPVVPVQHYKPNPHLRPIHPVINPSKVDTGIKLVKKIKPATIGHDILKTTGLDKTNLGSVIDRAFQLGKQIGLGQRGYDIGYTIAPSKYSVGGAKKKKTIKKVGGAKTKLNYNNRIY